MLKKLCCFSNNKNEQNPVQEIDPPNTNNTSDIVDRPGIRISNSTKEIPSQFAKYNINNTPSFTIDGKCCFARVIDIGDTITLALPLLNNVYKFNVAVPGIDCYELNGGTSINRESAVRARNRILELLDIVRNSENTAYTRREIRQMLNDTIYIVWVKCYGFEKFGRLFADIYINVGDKHSILEILLLENLVRKNGSKTT
jgi:hypothetical protein